MSRYIDRLNSMRMTEEEVRREDREGKMKKALAALRSADRIVIGGAAGLSASGGMDFFSHAVLEREFPGLAQRGYSSLWDAIWHFPQTLEQYWAMKAVEVKWARLDYPVCPVYRDLLDILGDKDYFVLTSNIDHQFIKAGFREDRVFEAQGSFTDLQCSIPCRQEVWDGTAAFEKIYAHIDWDSYTCPSDDIPTCPYCGAPVVQNGRDGTERFVRMPAMRLQKPFERFVEEAKELRTVFLELGAGFNSPGMIRHPFQRLTYLYPQAMLIRCNLDYPKVPPRIEEKSIWFGGDMGEVFASMAKLYREDPAAWNAASYPLPR